MNRRRALVALGSLGGAAACAALAAALVGCPNTAATSIYTPPTGIQIDSQQLVSGIGCGPGPGQVYQYAAVVTQITDAGAPFVTSGVFDCFTSALFANLPSPDGGPTDYGIAIYAYNRAAFPSALAGCDYARLSDNCAGDDAAVVRRFESQATWTTSCTATEYQGVPQVAVCGALVPADAGAGGDGGDAGDAGDAGEMGDATEAGDAPAPTEGGMDASDAGTAEASDGSPISGEGGDAPLE
ncbi:MAG TPA: hypothetical protein VF765_30400 [Polyangiaceae bacterium]